MSWILSPAPKPMQKKGIGLPGRIQEYVDPFFRTIFIQFDGSGQSYSLAREKKATRPVIGWRAFRQRFSNLVPYISNSSPKSRPLLRAGFVAPSCQFGFRPSPPLDRLAAEGGSKYPDMTSSPRLASTQNGLEPWATTH